MEEPFLVLLQQFARFELLIANVAREQCACVCIFHVMHFHMVFEFFQFHKQARTNLALVATALFDMLPHMEMKIFFPIKCLLAMLTLNVLRVHPCTMVDQLLIGGKTFRTKFALIHKRFADNRLLIDVHSDRHIQIAAGQFN